MADDERAEIVDHFAKYPASGDLIVGTGGARKARIAARGKGKSGGYRVITFYAEAEMPVFLLDIYSKSSRSNLSRAERNELKSILAALQRVWRETSRSRSRKPGRNG